jgi:hypothetical protein
MIYADQSGRSVEGMDCLRPLKFVIVGMNPTRDMDVCVYSVLVLFRMQVAALRRADSLAKVSYRLRTRSRI